MSCATNWPKIGQPAASSPSESGESMTSPQSHSPPARPSVRRNASSALKAGNSGNILAYLAGPIAASIGGRTRDGDRQCVLTDEVTAAMGDLRWSHISDLV